MRPTHWIHAFARLFVVPASAHCDTEDGPAVTDGRRSLETRNIYYALKWVTPAAEDELQAAFDTAIQEHNRGGGLVDAAEQHFLETLVRLHRAGEGEGFEGIKPTGTDLPPAVIAADRALDDGSIEPLRGLIPPQRWRELERRFTTALARKNFEVDDLDAARSYVAAYVAFFTYAEGEDHEHHHDHDHGHQH